MANEADGGDSYLELRRKASWFRTSKWRKALDMEIDVKITNVWEHRLPGPHRDNAPQRTLESLDPAECPSPQLAQILCRPP